MDEEQGKAIALKMFPAASNRRGLNDNFPIVLSALSERGLDDPLMFLVALSTIRAELNDFMPRTEGRSRYNAIGQTLGMVPKRLLVPLDAASFKMPEVGTGASQSKDTSTLHYPQAMSANRHADLEAGSRYEYHAGLNTRWGDGARFLGRGFVQITHRLNYQSYGAKIGRPWIERWPEMANVPQVAADLLAAFLETSEARIRAALATGWLGLRKVRAAVNGGSNGLTDFREAFALGLAASVDLGFLTTKEAAPFLSVSVPASRKFDGGRSA